MWKWQREVKKKSRNKMKISPQPPLKIILFEKWQIFFSQQTMQKAKTFSNKHGLKFFSIFIYIHFSSNFGFWQTKQQLNNNNSQRQCNECECKMSKTFDKECYKMWQKEKEKFFFFLNKRNISRFFFFFFILMVWIHSFSLNLNVFFLLLQLNKWMNFNRKKNFLNHYERMRWWRWSWSSSKIIIQFFFQRTSSYYQQNEKLFDLKDEYINKL